MTSSWFFLSTRKKGKIFKCRGVGFIKGDHFDLTEKAALKEEKLNMDKMKIIQQYQEEEVDQNISLAPPHVSGVCSMLWSM